MKKLFLSAAIVAAAVFGVMKATEVNNNMTAMQMENVEALANGGDDSFNDPCKPKNGRYCDLGWVTILDFKPRR